MPELVRRTRRAREAPTEKFCRGCGQTKDAVSFDRHPTQGLQSVCKDCRQARRQVQILSRPTSGDDPSVAAGLARITAAGAPLPACCERCGDPLDHARTRALVPPGCALPHQPLAAMGLWGWMLPKLRNAIANLELVCEFCFENSELTVGNPARFSERVVLVLTSLPVKCPECRRPLTLENARRRTFLDEEFGLSPLQLVESNAPREAVIRQIAMAGVACSECTRSRPNG